MSPVLVSLTDEKSFPLNRPSIFIGRDQWRVDVRLPGDAVDEVHCELIQHGTGFRLINLSDAGTLVNGQPVTEVVLEDGDELTIATHRLRLSCGPNTGDSRMDVRSDDSAEEEWAALNRDEDGVAEASRVPSAFDETGGESSSTAPDLWHIQLAGIELGPLPWDDLNGMVETGQAQETDPVRRKGSPDWRPFSDVVSAEKSSPASSPSAAVAEAEPVPDLLPFSEPREVALVPDPSDVEAAQGPPEEFVPDADPQYFVMLGETETGPVPLETLQQLALEYRLSGVTLVREESETEWTPAGALPIDIPPPVDVRDKETSGKTASPKRELSPTTPAQQFLARVKWVIFSPVFYLSNGVRAVLSLSPRTLAVSGVAAVIIGSVFFLWFRGWSQTALTGTLTLDGEPIPSVLVTLTGMSTGDTAVGFTDSNGRFSARTLDGDLLPGRYHVTVGSLPGEVAERSKGNDERPRIPTKYGSLGTTDVIVDVTPGSTDYPVRLTARLSGSGSRSER